MSEQTRHATPNLLISIHILWLLISSLLHSLFLCTFLPFFPSLLAPIRSSSSFLLLPLLSNLLLTRISVRSLARFSFTLPLFLPCPFSSTYSLSPSHRSSVAFSFAFPTRSPLLPVSREKFSFFTYSFGIRTFRLYAGSPARFRDTRQEKESKIGTSRTKRRRSIDYLRPSVGCNLLLSTTYLMPCVSLGVGGE